MRASHYHVTAGGLVAGDAAFFYPSPWPLARGLKDNVAFWRDVTVEHG